MLGSAISRIVGADDDIHLAAETNSGDRSRVEAHVEPLRLDVQILAANTGEEIERNLRIRVGGVGGRDGIGPAECAADDVIEQEVGAALVLEGVAERRALDAVSRDGLVKRWLMALVVLVAEELGKLDGGSRAIAENDVGRMDDGVRRDEPWPQRF